MSAYAELLPLPEEPSDELARPPGEDELPYDDGEPMESELHALIGPLLKSTLETRWADRQDFYVGVNMFVYFSPNQVLTHDFRGPDLFVAQNVVRRIRKSWVSWEENGRTPDVVLEITSQSTRRVDRGPKMEIYATVLKVPEYFIFHPFTRRLQGWRLDAATLRYAPMVGTPTGDLFSQQLGLWLGVRPTHWGNLQEPTLRWIDLDGRTLLTGEEMVIEERQRAQEERQRAQEERQRAQEERQRAEQLAARVAELEALLRRTGG